MPSVLRSVPLTRVFIAILCACAALRGQTPPTILANGIVNAGSSNTPTRVAPGSIVAIYGANMSSSPHGAGAQAQAFPLPTSLDGAQVLMNGIVAPLYYADSGQINAQVPWEVGGASTLSVQVVYRGSRSNIETAALSAIAPGIFVVVHASDYSLVTPAKPATPGEYLIVFCTGLGPVTNSPATGAAASKDTLSTALSTPTFTFGGVSSTPIFSGLTPGLAGLYQINVQVPGGIAIGSPVPLVLTSVDSSAASIRIPTGATFQLSELFGVAWPDQPIEFRYDGAKPDPATTRMIGPSGAEVPYQWVSSCSDATATKGCIAVRSNLPANSSYSWTLQSGVATASPVNPVQMNTVGNNL